MPSHAGAQARGGGAGRRCRRAGSTITDPATAASRDAYRAIALRPGKLPHQAVSEAVEARAEAAPSRSADRPDLPVDLAGPLVIPMLKEFMAGFPRVQPRLSCSSSAGIRTRLDAGESGFALLEELPSERPGECLAVEPLVWAGAPGGVAHGRDPLPISLASDNCCFHSQVLSALAASGRNGRTVLGNSGLDATVASVKAGIAVSVRPGATCG